MQPEKISREKITTTFTKEEFEWMGQAAANLLSMELLTSIEHGGINQNPHLKWKRELTDSILNLRDTMNIIEVPSEPQQDTQKHNKVD